MATMIKATTKLKKNLIPNSPSKPSVEIKAAPMTPAAASPKRKRISLQFVKPEAKEVFVAGSFNQWKPERAPLVPIGEGRWVSDLAVGPGRYEYLFVVDGEWMPDPNAKETVPNPYGGKNSVLTVSA